MPLYHKQLGFPAGMAERWQGSFKLSYSLHAIRASQSDRYGKIPLYRAIDFRLDEVIEIEVENGQPVKAVVRFPWSDTLDLVYVVNAPVGNELRVRTVWINEANDNHQTLDRSKYENL